MEHPWVMMYTVTCGIRLDALAIKPISSNSSYHLYTGSKIFFMEKILGLEWGSISYTSVMLYQLSYQACGSKVTECYM